MPIFTQNKQITDITNNWTNQSNQYVYNMFLKQLYSTIGMSPNEHCILKKNLRKIIKF